MVPDCGGAVLSIRIKILPLGSILQGKNGDALDAEREAMQLMWCASLRSCTFPEAIRFLQHDIGMLNQSQVRSGSPSPTDSSFLTIPDHSERSMHERPPEIRGHQSQLSAADAIKLVDSSERRLWLPEGLSTLAYLRRRGLGDDTIRMARLGWTPGIRLRTRDEDRYWTASGVVIPWLDGERLTLVKIRQPGGTRPKYVEAFRDRTTIFPAPSGIRPGKPIVIVEGEFDALLLGQAIGDLASVVTLGSASARPDGITIERLLVAPVWFIAADADDAGDRCASGWPGRARRARPPVPYNDWTDFVEDSGNLRRWWTERLAGIENPETFTFAEAMNHPYARKERAAIMEFEGGLNRIAAERAAHCAEQIAHG